MLAVSVRIDHRLRVGTVHVSECPEIAKKCANNKEVTVSSSPCQSALAFEFWSMYPPWNRHYRMDGLMATTIPHFSLSFGSLGGGGALQSI